MDINIEAQYLSRMACGLHYFKNSHTEEVKTKTLEGKQIHNFRKFISCLSTVMQVFSVCTKIQSICI